jgi:hypothetical protein
MGRAHFMWGRRGPLSDEEKEAKNARARQLRAERKAEEKRQADLMDRYVRSRWQRPDGTVFQPARPTDPREGIDFVGIEHWLGIPVGRGVEAIPGVFWTRLPDADAR